MLKGYLPAIIITVLGHLLLLALIYSHKIPSYEYKQNSHQAIKSFLYIKPKTVVKSEVSMAKKETLMPPSNEQPLSSEKDNIDKPPENINQQVTKVTDDFPPLVIKTDSSPPKSESTLTNPEPSILHTAPTKIISAAQQLKNLRSSLNRQISEQHVNQYKPHRSASVMHAPLEAVPHSTVKPSNEQMKKQNTTQLSADIAITKRDDGLCSIKQDLSNVGMEGISATSFFKCGESAFDKSFREHMKKVQAKLGK